jgi:hypothetical protein
MKFLNKEVANMTNVELVNANFEIDEMYKKVMEKRENPKFKAKFKNSPLPEMNSAFTSLRTEIDDELKKRKIT